MYYLEKIFSFEAGHKLDHHDGKCCHSHGHSYTLKIVLKSPKLNSNGPKKNMVVDFGDISGVIKPVIEKYLDHHWLNDTLETDSPTAEFMAHWLYYKVKEFLPELYSVGVSETASASAIYVGEE